MKKAVFRKQKIYLWSGNLAMGEENAKLQIGKISIEKCEENKSGENTEF